MAQQSSCASHFRPSRSEVVRDRHELVRHLGAQGGWPRNPDYVCENVRFGSKGNTCSWRPDSEQRAARAKCGGQLAPKLSSLNIQQLLVLHGLFHDPGSERRLVKCSILHSIPKGNQSTYWCRSNREEEIFSGQEGHETYQQTTRS